MQDPELGALGKAAVPAQAGGRSRPALPDVRGYTSPRGQAAGSTAGSFAARALLLLQEGSVGRGAAARPLPHAGHPLGKPWGSLAPRSGTQRDTRVPRGAKKSTAACTERQKLVWRGLGKCWCPRAVAGAAGSASGEQLGAGTAEQGTVPGCGAEQLSPVGGVSGKLPAGHPTTTCQGELPCSAPPRPAARGR